MPFWLIFTNFFPAICNRDLWPAQLRHSCFRFPSCQYQTLQAWFWIISGFSSKMPTCCAPNYNKAEKTDPVISFAVERLEQSVHMTQQTSFVHRQAVFVYIDQFDIWQLPHHVYQLFIGLFGSYQQWLHDVCTNSLSVCNLNKHIWDARRGKTSYSHQVRRQFISVYIRKSDSCQIYWL